MSDFRAGQRVRTTIHVAVDGGSDLPVGSLGTVTSELSDWGTYGVLLDGVPNHLPASFKADQLRPAQ